MCCDRPSPSESVTSCESGCVQADLYCSSPITPRSAAPPRVLLGDSGLPWERGGRSIVPALEGITTQLTFSRDNGSLGTHAILRGRMPEEEVRVVRSFTGQSLGVPDGATALMPLSPSAREAPTADDLSAEDVAARDANAPGAFGFHSVPVAGRAQGIAMTFGKGRVVVLGEAGFLSAQVIRYPDGKEVRFGMNVPGTDNQQFGLNALHWLSGLLK